MPSDIPLKDYVDARTDAVRAQNDARFAEVLAEMKGVSAKLDHIERNAISWKGVWGAAAATTVAVASIVLAVLSISGDRFDGGMSAQGIVSNVMSRQDARDAEQDKKLDAILERLDGISEARTPAVSPDQPEARSN